MPPKSFRKGYKSDLFPTTFKLMAYGFRTAKSKSTFLRSLPNL